MSDSRCPPENATGGGGTTASPVPADPESKSVKMRVHVLEIDHGSFSRNVELPRNVNKDRIEASYSNGLLWIELPKS